MDGSTNTAPGVAQKPNRRVAAKQATRLKIITAARVRFATPGGYTQATIRKLADDIGMSTGAVFANFKDKADLWHTVMECEPPLDGPATRAALPMQSALRGLVAIRPSNWEDDDDPDQVAAWRAAYAAIALAEGQPVRTPCAIEPGASA